MAESRFTAEQLRDKALLALEEVADAARKKSLRADRAKIVRFVLAYLGNGVADRTPFDDFWRAVTGQGPWERSPAMAGPVRGSDACGALCRIYAELGLYRGPGGGAGRGTAARKPD